MKAGSAATVEISLERSMGLSGALRDIAEGAREFPAPGRSPAGVALR